LKLELIKSSTQSKKVLPEATAVENYSARAHITDKDKATFIKPKKVQTFAPTL